MFLSLDGYPVDGSRSVSRWLAEQAAPIRFFRLLPCSPEQIPGQSLNQGASINALHFAGQVTAWEMVADFGLHLQIARGALRRCALKHFLSHYFTSTYTCGLPAKVDVCVV